MKSLWLRIEQKSDEKSAALTLWEGEFENRGDPISSCSLSLDPLIALTADGVPLWSQLVQNVRQSPDIQVGRFDEIGEKLRTFLETCPVWNDWLSRRKASTRTYLHIVDPPKAKIRLADLPFEYLGQVIAGLVDRYFTVLNQPILRVHAETAVPAAPLRHAKVLIISGEPIDWNNDSFPGTDVAAALRELQTCNLCVHIELLEVPTLQALEATLDRIKPEVIHFSGHGEVHPDTHRPALRINLRGNMWWWDTSQIYNAFNGKDWRPRLVVVNACDGAVPENRFASVKDAFAANGVAALIAAQAQIRQSAAPLISSALYKSLVAKEPIDVAMIKVRTDLGNQQGGSDWDRRDWGLPVLSVATTSEKLFARPERSSNLPDPEQVVQSCIVLREFVQTTTRTAPFVALGWPKERWDCLNYLSSAHCIVVKGVPGGGKSKLVLRSLRDAVFLDQQVRYVEVCSDRPDATFVDLLEAIVDGDPKKTQSGSQIHKPLNNECFAEFNRYRHLNHSRPSFPLPLNKQEQICVAFERGLKNASRNQELTIVLDQFSRDNPKSSFSPDEFKTTLLPFLWKRIAEGKVDGVRVIFVVRDSEYKDYALGGLNGSEIQLSQFLQADHPKLFYELCRFRRKLKTAVQELPTELFREVSMAMIGNNSEWPPSKFAEITNLIEKVP